MFLGSLAIGWRNDTKIHRLVRKIRKKVDEILFQLQKSFEQALDYLRLKMKHKEV